MKQNNAGWAEEEDPMSRRRRRIREMEDEMILELRRCRWVGDVKAIQGRILRAPSLRQSCFLATEMVNLWGANGRMNHAARVFEEILDPNIFLFNAMIRAFTKNQHYLESIALYKRMLRGGDCGDRFTFPFLLKSCGGLAQQLGLGLGKQIHLRAIHCGVDSNPVVGNSLTEMYARADADLADANRAFGEMRTKDAISWNTLIAGHARRGEMGKARALFESMPTRTVVSWTAMITGCSAAGRWSEAVELFRGMQMEGVEADDVSITSVLPACARLGDLDLGRWIHAYAARKEGFLRNTAVCNALIEMYCRCGSVEQALQLFQEIPHRDVVSWSAMIGGLAMHGMAGHALRLFAEMEAEEKGCQPNGVTFLGLLAACAHAGLLQQGLHVFKKMREVYGMEAGVEHYGCVVDLLGRAGCIRGAMEVIQTMPMPPDAAVWGSLLAACRTHGDASVAAVAMERLAQLEPGERGNYALLSSIYAAEKRWDDVATVRTLMRRRSSPGCSAVQVQDRLQEFVAGPAGLSLLTKKDMAAMLQLLPIMGTQPLQDSFTSHPFFDELSNIHK